MLFLMEARVIVGVAGISSPFERDVAYLVNAVNEAEADQKFQTQVRQDHAHMVPQTVRVKYNKIAREIK